MKIRLAECDYEFLRPPKDVFNVTHTDHYIKHGEGKKAVRKIFEDVKYPEDELEKLREFEALVAKENIALPTNWTKTDNIKMMFAGKFDFKKCIKVMRLHTEWRASPDRGIINPAAYKMLHDGILYISGRDKQYRPIIILNAYKIDLKTMDLSALIEALSFVLDTCIKFYFVPGKVENWVFIIETNGAGIINFPFKVVKSVNDATSVNYTSRLDKLYIMNPSSFLGASWKMVHSFLDPETASKIFMLKKSEFGKLLETIAPNQLEKRYGGTLELSAPFWPPVNTLGQPPYTVELMKEIEATKAQAVEAMKVQELVNLQHEEVKHEVKHEVQDQGARSKRNSVSYGIERNSPEIVIKAENSSPEEQRFAKMARPGSPGEEESLSMSPDTKKQKQILTDAKELIGTSPIQGMIRENVRRSSKQLDVEHKEQKEQPSYTVNVQHAKTLEANAFEEERCLGEGERDSSKKKVQVKSGVTFVGVDGHDVDDKQETSRRENGIVLEGQGSFRNEFCGFCRPKVKNDEQAAQESSSCSMF